MNIGFRYCWDIAHCLCSCITWARAWSGAAKIVSCDTKPPHTNQQTPFREPAQLHIFERVQVEDGASMQGTIQSNVSSYAHDSQMGQLQYCRNIIQHKADGGEFAGLVFKPTNAEYIIKPALLVCCANKPCIAAGTGMARILRAGTSAPAQCRYFQSSFGKTENGVTLGFQHKHFHMRARMPLAMGPQTNCSQPGPESWKKTETAVT